MITKLKTALFITYIVILTWGILFKFLPPSVWYFGMPYRSLNLIPYHDLARTWDGRLDVREIVLNILAFVPIGYYRYDQSHQLLNSFFWGIGLSLGYECCQFVLGIGMTDVTDVIHNSLGTLLGIVLARLINYSLS